MTTPGSKHHVVYRGLQLAQELNACSLMCEKHSSRAAEIYCDDCDVAFCSSCVSSHGGAGHTPLSLEEAADRLRGLVDLKRKNLEKTSVKTKTAQTKINRQLLIKTNEYQAEQEKIVASFTKAFNNLWNELNHLLNVLSDRKKSDLAAAEEQLQHFKFNTDCQTDILKWVQLKYHHDDNPTLDYLVQRERKTLLDNVLDQNCSFTEIDFNDVPQFQTIDSSGTAAVVGKLVDSLEKLTVGPGTILTTQLKPRDQFTLSFTCSRFSQIRDDEVWFMKSGSDVITVHDADKPENATKECALAGVGKCRSCVSLNNDVIIAASNGLFTMTSRGAETGELKCIAEGKFCDVAVFQNSIYALDDGNRMIRILQRNAMTKQEWKTQKSFSVTGYDANPKNAVVVTSCGVYVSVWKRHEIQHFNLFGEYIGCYGAAGNQPIEFQHPVVCQALENDDILVADSHNRRVVIMTADGSVNDVSLDTSGRCPLWVRIVNNNKELLVVYENKSVVSYAPQK